MEGCCCSAVLLYTFWSCCSVLFCYCVVLLLAKLSPPCPCLLCCFLFSPCTILSTKSSMRQEPLMRMMYTIISIPQIMAVFALIRTGSKYCKISLACVCACASTAPHRVCSTMCYLLSAACCSVLRSRSIFAFQPLPVSCLFG